MFSKGSYGVTFSCDPSITGFLAYVHHVVMQTEYIAPENGCFHPQVRHCGGTCLVGACWKQLVSINDGPNKWSSDRLSLSNVA